MRVLIVVLLFYFVLSGVITYVKNKIDNPPPGTLSYYMKKDLSKPLTEEDMQDVEKMLAKAGKLFPAVELPNKTLEQRVREDHEFYLYMLVVVIGLLLVMQYIAWEFARERFFDMIVLGAIFILFGIFSAYLSEQKISDVLLLRPSAKYIDLSLYAKGPIEKMIFGYGLVFNTVAGFVVDRVLTIKEIKSMFTAQD